MNIWYPPLNHWSPLRTSNVMWCFWLPKSGVTDANTIHRPTLQVPVWAENTSVGVNQLAAHNIVIWQEMVGLTTQCKNNKVREWIWEIAQCMSISNQLGAAPGEWDLLINLCVTGISDLVFNMLLWKWSMADMTIHDIQKLNAALDEFTEVGLPQRKNTIKQPPFRRWNLFKLDCISSLWCFFCCYWWCLNTADDNEQTSALRSLPKRICCD